jgi:hypothetical protein
MDLRLATLKAVSFYLLHNVSTLNQCRKLWKQPIFKNVCICQVVSAVLQST